mmetsp:Transcript_93511/g.171914  ORF Transcript_93511/g.171914 Transcript_93511/m.171914 type:complete len:177 (+) Transcript_93511:3-533(+)
MESLQQGDSLTTANWEISSEQQSGNWEIGPDPVYKGEAEDNGSEVSAAASAQLPPSSLTAPVSLAAPSPLAEKDEYLCIQSSSATARGDCDTASSLARGDTENSQPGLSRHVSFTLENGAFPQARISDAFIEQEIYRGDTFEEETPGPLTDELFRSVAFERLEHETAGLSTTQGVV